MLAIEKPTDKENNPNHPIQPGEGEGYLAGCSLASPTLRHRLPSLSVL